MSSSRYSQRILKRRTLIQISSNTSTSAKTTLKVLQQLPNEIILAIVAPLAFNDLKSTRLLSKAWCSCASVFLFANLSISPNKEDLQVFEAITNHPLLGKCVRHLWYNGSEFLLRLSKRQYLIELWRHDVSSYIFHLPGWFHGPSSDPEINSWIRQNILSPMGKAEAMVKFRNAKFLKDGYQNYHEHAIYQQRCLRDGEFYERLVQGLQKLDFLATVNLECQWGSGSAPLEPGKGSNLARNWSIFHCRPRRWSWRPAKRRGYLQAPDGAEHYRILVSALSHAQRRIRSFRTGECYRSTVPPYVFDRSRKTRSAKPTSFHHDNITAFSGMEELVLRFADYGEANTVELFRNVAGLPAVLGTMHCLKGLELQLPDSWHEDDLPNYYTYDQVFPEKMLWDKMKLLNLSQISIGATDLILLLLDAMPALTHLELDEIMLSQGSWEEVFEAIKKMHRLCASPISDYVGLYRPGGRELSQDYNICGLYGKLGSYVVYGGRHPCLRSEQPNSAAEEYTKGLEPELRQRLMDLDNLSSKVEDVGETSLFVEER